MTPERKVNGAHARLDAELVRLLLPQAKPEEAPSHG